MKCFTITLLLALSCFCAAAQRASICLRTGGSKWMYSNFYKYSVNNPTRGDRSSWDNEIFFVYQTKQLFAIDAGMGYFQKSHKERRKGRTLDIISNNLENSFSPMWKVISAKRLECLLGGSFSLINDLSTKRFNLINDYGYIKNSN